MRLRGQHINRGDKGQVQRTFLLTYTHSPETRHTPRAPRTTRGWGCGGEGAESQWGVLPDELPAVRTVGGLPQVCGHKLVSVDLMDAPSHSSLALPGEMLEDAVSLEGGCG